MSDDEFKVIVIERFDNLEAKIDTQFEAVDTKFEAVFRRLRTIENMLKALGADEEHKNVEHVKQRVRSPRSMPAERVGVGE